MLKLFTLVLLTLASASGQVTGALHSSQWLQSPDGFNSEWDSLRGKVVVLEFWATWCPPCVRAIPHLNELAKEFREQPVVFLAITDDDVDRIKGFMEKQPIDAIIGIDPERKNWEAFGVLAIPHTVLIGKTGQIIGSTMPENITGDVLRETLAGREPKLPPKEGIDSDLSWDENRIDWQDGVAPTMYAIIKPIKTATSGIWPRPAHITADGVPLQVLVQAAYETDSYHVDWRGPKSSQAYRAAFRVPEQQKERLLPYMRQTLAELFGITARWEDREREVLILRKLEQHSGPPPSRSDKQLSQMMRGKLTLREQPIRKLCQFLGSALHAIVIDETGLPATYDFDLPYQPGEPNVTIQALKDIGLEVERAKRNIRMLVVTEYTASANQ